MEPKLKLLVLKNILPNRSIKLNHLQKSMKCKIESSYIPFKENSNYKFYSEIKNPFTLKFSVPAINDKR